MMHLMKRRRKRIRGMVGNKRKKLKIVLSKRNIMHCL